MDYKKFYRTSAINEIIRFIKILSPIKFSLDEGRAPAGGFASTAAETAAVLGEVVAAESNDVTVMAKLSEMFKEASTMYREITMERMELQKQMVAALAATTGGAAVPEPDAAAAAPYMPAVGV
jgi:hypothetical protein